MTLGTIVYADPHARALSPRGAPARVIETMTRQREGERAVTELLLVWVATGERAWVRAPGPPTLRVQGAGRPA